MKNLVYIAHDCIQIIKYKKSYGKVDIKEIYTEQIPERALINGVVMNEAAIATSLKNLQKAHPEAFRKITLVIDSSEITVKRIPVPKLSKRQYLRLVSEELGEKSIKNTGLIFSYYLIKENSGERTIIGSSVNEDLIEEYLSLFNNSGIELNKIHIGLESMVQYVNQVHEYPEKEIIINLYDGMNMLSAIFKDGKPMFFKRTRIVSEGNDYVTDFLSRDLAQIIQFAKTQEIGEISRSYYLGLPQQWLDSIKISNQMQNVKVLPINIDNIYIRSFRPNLLRAIPVMEMLANGKRSDFKSIYIKNKDAPKKSAVKKPVRASYIIYPVVFTMLLVGFLIPTFLGDKINREIFIYSEYLNNSKIESQVSDIMKKRAELNKKWDIINRLESYNSMELNYPKVTDDLYDYIIKNAGKNISVMSKSFDSDNASLKLNCIGTLVTSAADYVALLRLNSLVADVSYTGYQLIGEAFNFDIILRLVGEKADEKTDRA